MNDDKTKPPRIGRKVLRAIDLLANGDVKTIKAAADGANMTREHLSRQLKLPHVAALVEERTRATLASGALRASSRMVELLDSKSEHVSADVAARVLAIGGVAPPQPGTTINVNTMVSPGYCISFADPRTHQFDGTPLPEGEDRRRLLVERGLITDATVLPAPPVRGPTYHVDATGRLVADGDGASPAHRVMPVGTQAAD